MSVEFIVYSVLIGAGATVVMDLWAIILKRLFDVPSLNYAMVGRWIGHMPHGRFSHDAIGKATPINHEGFIGWVSHYLIGIAFAGLLLTIWGVEWAQSPTLLPAITIGVGTIVAPFFVLQPSMGAGVAASKTPEPNIARQRSLLAHTVFGVGLYSTALLLSLLV